MSWTRTLTHSGHSLAARAVYWGPDAGGPVIYPPPAELAVNTTPDKFNTHLHGGGIRRTVKLVNSMVSDGGGGANASGYTPLPTSDPGFDFETLASSTGETVLLPTDTSSVIVPTNPDLDASARSFLGSVTDAGTAGSAPVRT